MTRWRFLEFDGELPWVRVTRATYSPYLSDVMARMYFLFRVGYDFS